jgi:NAD(P)-dependent dehydrogenase (short-subunit alcohol dehydrogenase family)
VTDLVARAEDISGTKGSCAYIRGDIAEAGTRGRILDFVRDRHGYLDVLVNNAGITTEGRKDMLELSEEEILRVMRVNLIAPFLLTAELAKLYPGSGSMKYIINISSISAYTASVNRADYCMSKSAMSMMTKLYAARLADRDVRVFEVRPGIIRTGMTGPVSEKYDALIAEGLLPVARWGEPEDVARAVAALTRGHFDYTAGEVINVDGGFRLRRL